DTESLKDTYERVLEFYKQEIENKISNNNILISAHGNSIRALCKYLFKLDENQISKLEIPTGNPLVIKLDEDNKITDCKYLDKERAKDLVVF
ncbi:2,3-bisphosphoglycerate-dependent phosphoglycerate mutase, partial [Candidatus Woesearchaeota archaeon]|nr:2,3-bisphosphoglycerate-dependent phosphoglycerate mutase [Candidatus Woesearchaeota archaeon]